MGNKPKQNIPSLLVKLTKHFYTPLGTINNVSSELTQKSFFSAFLRAANNVHGLLSPNSYQNSDHTQTFPAVLRKILTTHKEK